MAAPLRKVYPGRWDVPLLLLAASASFPAGLVLPMMRVEKLWAENEFSVLSGIVALFREGHWGLGALLLAFSVLFPTVKLAVVWMVWAGGLRRPDRKRLLLRLKQLGKWSMLDVFVVALTVVAVKLGSLAAVIPLPGIYVFAASVLLSMVVTVVIERLTERADRAGL